MESQQEPKMSAKRFKRLIKAECVDLMQTNVAAVIEGSSVENPEFKSQQFIDSAIESWRQELRMAAYIFGDSYGGMPTKAAFELLENEEFQPIHVEYLNSRNKNQLESNRIVTYSHKYLNIRLLMLIKADRMCSMNLEFTINVNVDTISNRSLCGMGMIEMKVEDNTMCGQMEVTGGLSTKLSVLKSFATADQEEHTVDI